MRRIACLLVLAATVASSAAWAASVSVTAKLVDRQCSVEDVFQLQPWTAKYCTLWLKETTVVAGVAYTRVFTAYCPRTTINGIAYASYDTCSDPGAMQIDHPSRLYVLWGHLRTPAEMLDNRGEFIVTSVTY